MGLLFSCWPFPSNTCWYIHPVMRYKSTVQVASGSAFCSNTVTTIARQILNSAVSIGNSRGVCILLFCSEYVWSFLSEYLMTCWLGCCMGWCRLALRSLQYFQEGWRLKLEVWSISDISSVGFLTMRRMTVQMRQLLPIWSNKKVQLCQNHHLILQLLMIHFRIKREWD